MASFIHNVQSVSKYESKLLTRSWFFRIFAFLAIGVLFFYDLIMFAINNGPDNWSLIAVPSNIPYVNLLMLNGGQAVIAIFLASDFMKRDTKMDTSEVFYVRPLSNAEYVTGKIWGNLRVFFVLNVVIMAIAVILTYTAGVAVEWTSYLKYFLLISLPTLV